MGSDNYDNFIGGYTDFFYIKEFDFPMKEFQEQLKKELRMQEIVDKVKEIEEEIKYKEYKRNENKDL